ncbi:MAG: exodeoxyribonuclease VII large subunit [Rhodanobacteraceae bacterium]
MPAESPPLPPARETLTPSALTRLVRDLIEDALPLVWIEGEISNCARPASGHLYFTLKDAAAQVRCAMFRPKSTWLRFRPVDGMHVLARARVSLYEARGEFQLIIEHMEEAGEGALRREFERLKNALAAEGLFDAANKRALPRLARRIGVITSPSGAAIRDVVSVVRRRFALADLEVLPVPVQGREAPAAIVAMLQAASAAGRHDVLLLTRGGGSLEDLWAFNDEGVARAIRASAIPVVCAVGHEIDFTIADFVADLRAPTPSAAAELLVPDARDLSRLLAHQRDRIASIVRRRLETLAQCLDQWLARLNARRPQALLMQTRERLCVLRRRLRLHQSTQINRRRTQLSALQARLLPRHPALTLAARGDGLMRLIVRLRTAGRRDFEQRRLQLAERLRTLTAISPQATLERGYAILLEAESDRVVRSVDAVRPGDALRARLADGEMPLHVDAEGERRPK